MWRVKLDNFRLEIYDWGGVTIEHLSIWRKNIPGRENSEH